MVKEVRTDCDQDALLLTVEALGPGVCHAGYKSCFYRKLDNGAWSTVDPQTYDPNQVYGG